jgi:hypothetical protein
VLGSIRTVINWFFKWGEHAKFVVDVGKFVVEYFGLWKMFASIEIGLMAAVAKAQEASAKAQEASPFLFGVSWFAVTLVIINVILSLYNKWKITEPKMVAAVAHDANRQILIAQARDFVSTTMRQDKGYEYFQHALEPSEIYLKLRPHLKEEFHRALTSGFVIVAAPRASDMPGIAWAFIGEIERLEKEWNLR